MKSSALLDDVAVDGDGVLSLVADRTRKRREDLRVAFDLAGIERSGHFRAEGCASIGEFGERYGLVQGPGRPGQSGARRDLARVRGGRGSTWS